MGAISIRDSYVGSDLNKYNKIYTQTAGKESTVNLSVITANKPIIATDGAADTENMSILSLLVRVFVVDGTVTLTDTNSVEYAYGKSVILLPVIAGAYWESTITNNVLSGKSNAVKYEKIVLKPGQSIYTHVLGPYGTFNAGGLETNPSAGATTAVKYVVRVEGFEDTV